MGKRPQNINLSYLDKITIAILLIMAYNGCTKRKGDRMYKNIGELISRRRKQLGMNQAQLAACLNMLGFPISNQAISKWENGSTLPNARQFLALCDALGIDDIRGVFSGHGEGLLAGLNREGRRKVMDYVQLLRDTGRYSDRQDEASANNCDFLVSIHFNAGGGTGSESYIHTIHAAPGSEELQDIMHKYLVEGLGLVDRGQKEEQFAVVGGKVPGVLLEVCFIDNANDMAQYQARKQTLAEKLAAGIAEFAQKIS